MHLTKPFATAVAVTALFALPATSDAAAHHAKKAPHHVKHAKKLKKTRVFTTPAAALGQPAPQGAGQVTVASFSGGVLTLTLADGSTTKGTVDSTTEIECDATPAMTTRSHDSGDSQDTGTGSQSGDEHGAPPATTHPSGDNAGQEDDNELGEDQSDTEGADASCTTAALVAGTVVKRAALQIAGGVATFRQLALIVPAA